jgi:hypothetical protein
MTTLRHGKLTAGQEGKTARIVETPRNRLQTCTMGRRTRGSGQPEDGEPHG